MTIINQILTDQKNKQTTRVETKKLYHNKTLASNRILMECQDSKTVLLNQLVFQISLRINRRCHQMQIHRNGIEITIISQIKIEMRCLWMKSSPSIFTEWATELIRIIIKQFWPTLFSSENALTNMAGARKSKVKAFDWKTIPFWKLT